MKEKSSVETRLIQYGLVAIILGTTLLNGGGAFFETRALLYFGTLFLVIVWFLKGVREKQFVFPESDIDIPAALFLLVATASIYKLANLHASLDGLLLVLSYLLFYWLVAGSVKGKERIYFFTTVLCLVGFALACLGIYQYLFGFKLLTAWAKAKDLTLAFIPDRAFAVFISPNHLAILLAMVFGVVFIFLLNARAWWQRILAGISAVTIGCCLYLTFSRGGWISFALIITILIFGLMRKRWLKASIIFVVVIALVAVSSIAVSNYASLISPKTTKYTAKSTVAVASTSFSGRIFLWQGALKMIKSAPLLGKGIGTFASVYPLYQVDGLYSQYAHNTYLQIFAETGILGFILFLAIFFLILRRQYLVFCNAEEGFLKDLSLALFAGGAGFALHNLADFSWLMAGVAIIFWSFAALSICIERAGKESDVNERNVLKGRVLSVVSVIVVLAVLAKIGLITSSLQAYLFSEQGQYLYKERKFDVALQAFEGAVKYDPISADYQHALANSYEKESAIAGKENFLSKAIAHSKKAVLFEPSWARHHSQLGLLYWRAGEFSKAQTELKRAKELYPNEPYFPVILGKFYLSQGKNKKAAGEFEYAVSLEKYYKVWYPEEAHKNISDAWLNLGNESVQAGKLAEALAYYNKAIKLDFKNSPAYFNRGWLYHRQGSFKKALADYKRADKLNPNYPLIHFNMGLLYEQGGDLRQAALEFKKVVELEPANEEAKQKLEKLKGL